LKFELENGPWFKFGYCLVPVHAKSLLKYNDNTTINNNNII